MFAIFTTFQALCMTDLIYIFLCLVFCIDCVNVKWHLQNSCKKTRTIEDIWLLITIYFMVESYFYQKNELAELLLAIFKSIIFWNIRAHSLNEIFLQLLRMLFLIPVWSPESLDYCGTILNWATSMTFERDWKKSKIRNLCRKSYFFL